MKPTRFLASCESKRDLDDAAAAKQFLEKICFRTFNEWRSLPASDALVRSLVEFMRSRELNVVRRYRAALSSRGRQ